MGDYKTPEEIYSLTFISPRRLQYYRQKGYLKNIYRSPGSMDEDGKLKGGWVKYDFDEVKEVFKLTQTLPNLTK